MDETKEARNALMDVVDSMARACWIMVRLNADMHARIFRRVRDVADGALSKLEAPPADE